MKRLTIIAFLLVGIVGISTTTTFSAAFEEDLKEWTPVEETTREKSPLFIQNDSYFPLIITYKPTGSAETIAATLPSGWGIAAGATFILEQPGNITGNISIRISLNKLESLKKLSVSIPWFQTASSLTKPFLPASITLLSNYMTEIAATTIEINPRDYAPNTILAFYWPLAIAAAHYPPALIPLEDSVAATAWIRLQNKLNCLISTSKYGMKKAFNITKDLVADAMKKPVNDQAIMARAKEADAFIHAQQLAPFEFKEEYLPQE